MRYPTVTLGGTTYAIVPLAEAARAGLGSDPAVAQREKQALRLRKARERAGLTQAELAARLGAGQTYVSGVETARDAISDDRAETWLAACRSTPRTKKR
ncbi:MAG: helix-turn-helix transcriptional regulator [Rhodospirillales bacterium]|nr:helix-turn-helix transcriptional regulator [Rhodospirillales bacterium]